jgi:PadR family transcriptional regulator, regulatory protein PadR
MEQDAFDSQGIGRRINELLLLSVLRRGPLHGYQAALEIEQRSGGYFRFNHGTLYPILHRLEQEGLIAGGWTDPEEGRARKEYALTRAGHSYLAELETVWRELGAQLEGFIGAGRRGDEKVRTGVA